MRTFDNRRLYSASDLVNFLGCGHATALDVRQLTDAGRLSAGQTPKPSAPAGAKGI